MSQMDDNPYASPRAVENESVRVHPELFGTLTKKRWVYRRIELNGKSNAIIEYNSRGLGYETVFVNGEIAARVTGNQIEFATPIDFAVPSVAGTLAARIEIRTAFLLFLGAFRLLIDGCVVYTEGTW